MCVLWSCEPLVSHNTQSWEHYCAHKGWYSVHITINSLRALKTKFLCQNIIALSRVCIGCMLRIMIINGSTGMNQSTCIPPNTTDLFLSNFATSYIIHSSIHWLKELDGPGFTCNYSEWYFVYTITYYYLYYVYAYSRLGPWFF